MRKIVSIFVFLSIFLVPSIVHAQAGVIGASTAAGIAYQMYVTWKDGEAKKYYEYSGELMQDATIRAIKKMKLPVAITKDVAPPKKHLLMNGIIPDVKFGDYTISAGHNDRFRIKVIEVESNITRVTIRVNTMGDKEYAELLYKMIDEQVNIVDFTTKKKVKVKK